MGYTVLLNKDNAPLKRLALARIQLDAESPFVTVGGPLGESVLYSLTGSATVYTQGTCLGTLGGRQRIEEPQVQCIRFKGQHLVTVGVVGHAADLLWVTCEPKKGFERQEMGYHSHLTDAIFHTVGVGTNQRIVAEVPRVAGYELDVGETHNERGAWSSWPAHANEKDIERFSNGETTWEEAFFCICEHPGVLILNGVYSDGKVVNKLQAVHNGNAYAMPLGSHPIVSHPNSSLWYFWGYCGDALEKIYRRAADDTGVYRK